MTARRQLIDARLIVDHYIGYDTGRIVDIDEIFCNSKSIDLSEDGQFKYYGTKEESINKGYMINYENAILLCETIGEGNIEAAISYLTCSGLTKRKTT